MLPKIRKCLYLINLLERKGAMTLKEINESYQYSSIYEGDNIIPRTFLRYKDFIEHCMAKMILYSTICCQPITSRV